MLVCLVVACDAHAAPPEAQKTLAPTGLAAVPESSVRKATSDQADKGPAFDDTAARARRSALVERFVARDLLVLTSAQAKERFSTWFDLQPERESIDGFVLAGGSAAERVELSYSPDGKGKFYMGVASLSFYASNGQVAELQRELSEQLTKKLPTRRAGSASGLRLEWNLSRRVKVVLIDYPSRRPNPGERLVELRIAELGGP